MLVNSIKSIYSNANFRDKIINRPKKYFSEPERDGRDNGSPDISSDGLKNVNSEDGLVIKTSLDHGGVPDLDIEEYILQGAVPKHVIESFKDGNLS